MNKVITLLTDFGASVHYPAVMKGVILSGCPDVSLIDITHNCPTFQVKAAAFILWQTVRAFDMPAVHLVVVDPGVGTNRGALAVKVKDRGFLVGPDNGVLSWTLHGTDYIARRLDAPGDASLTFHGRDVFAPAAAVLACNPQAFEDMGPVVTPVDLPMPGFSRNRGDIHAQVLFMDDFGNVLVTVHQDDRIFVPEKPLSVVTKDDIFEFQYGTYGNVRPDGLCWHYDSSGYVELSVREGSFARLSGLSWDSRLILRQ